LTIFGLILFGISLCKNNQGTVLPADWWLNSLSYGLKKKKIIVGWPRKMWDTSYVDGNLGCGGVQLQALGGHVMAWLRHMLLVPLNYHKTLQKWHSLQFFINLLLSLLYN
jgi:hypothetical protein